MTKLNIEHPAMRDEVLSALRSLADPDLQERYWIRKEFPSAGYFEDLTLNIHLLYDDMAVLPDPASRIGIVLRDGAEVATLQSLNAVLDPLIDRLGGAPDVEYLHAPEWPEVVAAAREALVAMLAP